jgi:hypothetical protein
MSTTASPLPGTAPAESELQKIWNWIKAKVTIVEEDLAKLIGPNEAQALEAAGKKILDSWIGPLAHIALMDATDVVTGKMSVSKAVGSLVASAASSGKTITAAAALQVIALTQNSLPTKQDATVTPIP